jgi:hypothetical protein
MKRPAKLKLHEIKWFEFHLLACGGAISTHVIWVDIIYLKWHALLFFK